MQSISWIVWARKIGSSQYLIRLPLHNKIWEDGIDSCPRHYIGAHSPECFGSVGHQWYSSSNVGQLSCCSWFTVVTLATTLGKAADYRCQLTSPCSPPALRPPGPDDSSDNWDSGEEIFSSEAEDSSDNDPGISWSSEKRKCDVSISQIIRFDYGNHHARYIEFDS